jgi:hypothetical protein
MATYGNIWQLMVRLQSTVQWESQTRSSQDSEPKRRRIRPGGMAQTARMARAEVQGVVRAVFFMGFLLLRK